MQLSPRALLVPALLLLAACGSSTSPGSSGGPSPQPTGTTPPLPPAGGARTPLVSPTDPLYARLEGTQAKNDCQSDAQCVKGGCSGEVCAAEDVTSTCEMPADGWPTQGASCGCLEGQCRWYTTDGRTPPPTSLCAAVTCLAGEHCFEFVGVTGRPVAQCGVRCDPSAQPNGGCPAGKRCGTIPDGPGPVCH